MQTPFVAPLFKSINRLITLGLILTGWSVLIVFRLVQFQVLAHDDLAKKGQHQQQQLEVIEAPRGAIFDRAGNYLAISSTSQFAVVDPKRIPDKATASALLARVLNLDAAKLQTAMETVASRKRHNGYLVVDAKVTDEQANELRALSLDWLEIRQGSLRTYPNHDLAAHVIGEVDAEGHGAAGIELKLDKELTGTPGLRRVNIDVRREGYAAEITRQPVVGKNVELTIDSEMQQVAQEAIQHAVTANHADHGSIVAIDPHNGEILALANYPSYDPNERLLAGEKPHGREDLAVVAPYEPGSVFKVITVSAALETTKLTPNTMIKCAGGVLTLFGRTIHDAEGGHGDLSVADVLAKSSNVGAIRIGMEVGAPNMYEYVRRFGVGKRTGIELPAEAPGMLRPLRRWQATSLASVAFGHEISVTTVQLARIGSVIANGGFLIHPHVIAWKQAPGEPKEVPQFPPPQQVLKPETVMTMRQLMRRVVLPGGTAQHLHLIGYTLAGKTGTAQIFDFAHHVYTHHYNASFMGFAPMNNPSVLVVVTVSGTTGGPAAFGASASGPAFEAVATAALRLREVPRDVPQEVEDLEQKQLAERAKLKRKHAEPIDADTLASADVVTPPTEQEMREAMGEDAVTEAPLDGPKTPNFVGKTVKEVVELAAGRGIDVDLLGDGVARAQSLPPGSAMVPGERISVRFSR
ncbi:MAG TPA: penicillin-binding protein [Bryobacteraceae bacterium]|jgi:cell division protein FtsI (penicillin-binding protein 3)|nr:penicillin-binding protein [Bryobacteraceae bacterium]